MREFSAMALLRRPSAAVAMAAAGGCLPREKVEYCPTFDRWSP
jgi:hypothetical protein